MLEKTPPQTVVSSDFGGIDAMLRGLAIVIGLIGVVLLLDGCTKCGPVWNDWGDAQKSCRS